MTNRIKKMLGITNENLETLSVEESILKDKKTLIINLLSKTISYTLISDLCSVSINSVIRILRRLEVYLPKTKGDALLPKVLIIDKFRLHAPHEDK